MILQKPITIKPPPYSDDAGNVVYPDSMILHKIDPIYYDFPSRKKLTAHIEPMPWSLKLIDDDAEYDAFGDYTVSQREQLLIKKLGSDPAAVLQSLFPPTLEQDPSGPGTILASMIKKFGIKMTPNCSCLAHALSMNKQGPDWCEENIDKISDWIKEETTKRKIPFVEIAVKMMIRQAISKSRKMMAENGV